MPFPIIPLIGVVLTTLGIGSAAWYYSLPPKKREEADRLASQYAKRIYNKAFDDLTRDQAENVLDYVRRHLGL